MADDPLTRDCDTFRYLLRGGGAVAAITLAEEVITFTDREFSDSIPVIETARIR